MGLLIAKGIRHGFHLSLAILFFWIGLHFLNEASMLFGNVTLQIKATPLYILAHTLIFFSFTVSALFVEEFIPQCFLRKHEQK
jgi:hypothetical protein